MSKAPHPSMLLIPTKFLRSKSGIESLFEKYPEETVAMIM